MEENKQNHNVNNINIVRPLTLTGVDGGLNSREPDLTWVMATPPYCLSDLCGPETDSCSPLDGGAMAGVEGWRGWGGGACSCHAGVKRVAPRGWFEAVEGSSSEALWSLAGVPLLMGVTQFKCVDVGSRAAWPVTTDCCLAGKYSAVLRLGPGSCSGKLGSRYRMWSIIIIWYYYFPHVRHLEERPYETC